MQATHDILSDFILPPSITAPDGNFFTFTGMRVVVGSNPPPKFKVTKATKAEFPASDGQSVSYAVLQFPSGGMNPLHTHPHFAELLFLVQGSLEVGEVDTTGKLYAQTLQKEDMFLFPKGLVHYQYNSNAQYPAMALSAFGSASAGTVSIPTTLFTGGTSDDVLAKSLKTDVATIQKLKAGLAPPKP
ncbi:hypothetical protein AMTRI_Chr11g154920 [Amborella trichopoda]|uniref:Germin-like protein n=1 Tax=Amborella trichopoda TaxID=13333 RepID=W1NQK8_AMBTC|nr:hypothetical protein AMTR_s00121p00132150 [Amborella trichopoda]